ncbi:MAG: ornithine carbamoyltransferase [Gemmatimonadetes bacterium]|nr:ornithine carbamoyltransferase [Gemmatimonadota bacterium]NIR77622.1 ornithine carbamoyltransferase [Gemmatimonadota bacterium]NIT88904.1 ornithine carbamoyltransferase [Gemmatimonadota bacterium]NIU33181.1 ornithine carbamoyltransferase [Gemmatimonadota bacterium]NIU34956.1 ornithine carbamoyltransferase [Gemmatimonadota bacterium]
MSHFLEIPDLDADELRELLARALRLKRGEERADRSLEGRALAMIFRKSSTRTRVSFEVGMHELGGHAVFLAERDTQMGRGESVADTARVLSGYVDGIMIRTFAHAEVTELARHASVPVINGLTDLLHPCQVLADVLTAMEEFGWEPRDLSGIRVAWIGDGNNVANSWINAALRLGFELRLACPEGYEPDPGTLERAREAGSRIEVTREIADAARDAHVVTTDVWASMGQEDEARERAEAFRGYQVDGELMAIADDEAIFLHCLPAHRGEEVTAEVIDGPRSRVFEEAENRLHVQKALLLELMG